MAQFVHEHVAHKVHKILNIIGKMHKNTKVSFREDKEKGIMQTIWTTDERVTDI